MLARAVLARASVGEDLHKTEGYKRLSPDWKGTLDALASGATVASRAAPAKLRELLDAPGPRTSETVTFKLFVEAESYLADDIVPPDDRDLRRHVHRYTVGQPARVRQHPFMNVVADALCFPVTIWIPQDGSEVPKVVPIFVAQSNSAPGSRSRAMAVALAQLPPEALALINSVHLNPVPFEEGADPAQTSSTFMSTSRDGSVFMYPHARSATERYVVSGLLHETGHVASLREFGSPKAKAGWAEWKAAKSADHVNVSTYGNSNIGDDFAESWALWFPTRGTPREADVAALIPNRVRIMRGMLRRSAELNDLAADLLPPADRAGGSGG